MLGIPRVSGGEECLGKVLTTTLEFILMRWENWSWLPEELAMELRNWSFWPQLLISRDIEFSLQVVSHSIKHANIVMPPLNKFRETGECMQVLGG